MGTTYASTEPHLHEDHLLAWACVAGMRREMRAALELIEVDEEVIDFRQ